MRPPLTGHQNQLPSSLEPRGAWRPRPHVAEFLRELILACWQMQIHFFKASQLRHKCLKTQAVITNVLFIPNLQDELLSVQY